MCIRDRHNVHFRSEFEFTYRSNDEQAIDIGGVPAPLLLDESADVYSIMKNFFYDFGNQYSRFRPYLGIGLGYSYLDTDFATGSGVAIDDESAFAWQPIGGVATQINQVTHAFFEYRYFGTSDFELTEAGVESQRSGNYNSHNLFFGLRFEW